DLAPAVHQIFERSLLVLKSVAKGASALLRSEWLLEHGCDIRILEFLFPPNRPELSGRAHSAVLHLVLVGGNEQLNRTEKLRDFLRSLVTDVLGDGFFKVLVRPFAFDYAERNAVNKQNDVGPPCLAGASALDIELFADMEEVVCGVIPIDVLERAASRVA